MQIPLFKPDRLEPLPIGTSHYVMAVQNKAGELDALRNASDRAWKQMTPLVQIVGPKDRSRALRPETLSTWGKKIAGSVGSHPFYLDVMRLTPTKAVRTKWGDKPVLEMIYESARRWHLRFVPVVWASESDESHIAIARNAALEDGHGLALRVRIRTNVPVNSTWGDHLAAQVKELTREGDMNTDLIVDLEHLQPDTELEAEDLGPMLQKIIDAAPWRALVLLGTSMPKTLSCIHEGTLGTLRRMEWQLWLALADYGLSRMPCFGDYAIQHPRPPDEGGGPGMRANIRYTSRSDTFIARGSGPVIQEGKAQYRQLCRQLVNSGEFKGAAFSWGDNLIEACARGIVEPGAQPMWRGAGTSHHLEYVTDQLLQRQTRQ